MDDRITRVQGGALGADTSLMRAAKTGAGKFACVAPLVAALISLLAFAPGAEATGQLVEIKDFTVTPSTALAGANPSLTISARFCDTYTSTQRWCTPAQYDAKPKDLITELPEGLVGFPESVPACPVATFLSAADVMSGSPVPCPAASIVGTALVKAVYAPGEVAIPIPGQVFNLQPQGTNLAQFGIRLDAGSANFFLAKMMTSLQRTGDGLGLSNVATDVPNSISVAHAPNPTVQPVKLQSLSITLNGVVGGKPFLRNPTRCGAVSFGLNANAYPPLGDTTRVVAPPVSYDITGCESLPFDPSLETAVASSGGRYTTPGLTTKSELPSGDSNIKRAEITWPKSLRASLHSLSMHVCRSEQELGTGCGSVGTLDVKTPMLSKPLSGPVYIVNEPGQLRVKVVVPLDGPLAFTLRGYASFEGVRTMSVFEDLPDVPISSLSFSLKSNNGIFVAVDNLCGAGSSIDTKLTAQSGSVNTDSLPLTAAGCQPASLSVAAISPKATKSGQVAVTVSCAANGFDCNRGSVSLAASVKQSKRKGKRKHGRKPSVSVGTASVDLDAGDRKTVVVRLSRTARKALAKQRSLRVTASATVSGRTRTANGTVRVAKRGKR